jgi:hypothetical protein
MITSVFSSIIISVFLLCHPTVSCSLHHELHFGCSVSAFSFLFCKSSRIDYQKLLQILLVSCILLFLYLVGFKNLVYYSHCSVRVCNFSTSVFFVSTCDIIRKIFKTIDLFNNFITYKTILNSDKMVAEVCLLKLIQD